ncbi:MAG TPA: ArsI/CadI family heavy metal resistance metalloenzyme [Chlorobiota bacterium]|nr:ArsI/CadI family heavy metal resistance metalloenzyme [Chlorobiota bacterium]
MKRLHVHVSVVDLDDSIRFYSTMFATQPTVVKADYAKWMLDDPRVNFAISQRGATPGLNHLGVQVESTEELKDMHQRLELLEREIVAEEGAACCYAKSDKYWAEDPQGIAWETFHTLDTIPVFGTDTATMGEEACGCTPKDRETTVPVAEVSAPCCGPSAKEGACC